MARMGMHRRLLWRAVPMLSGMAAPGESLADQESRVWLPCREWVAARRLAAILILREADRDLPSAWATMHSAPRPPRRWRLARPAEVGSLEAVAGPLELRRRPPRTAVMASAVEAVAARHLEIQALPLQVGLAEQDW